MNTITLKQKKVLELIYGSIKDSGFPPTLADLRSDLGVSSNQSILNFLDALEKKGFIEREDGKARGIKIKELGFKLLNRKPLVRLVGNSSCGPFIESLNESFNWIDLPGRVLKNEKVSQAKEDLFSIKVQGDSMINAGINDGDILLVKKAKEFRSGDIVVARSDDGTTIKRFIVESKGASYLKPENPKYKNIPIFEETIFDGKVILNLSAINRTI